MNCPRGCPTELSIDTVVGVEVDRCATCQGMWLDLGEGEIVSRPSEDLPQELLDQVAALDPSAKQDASAPLACPRCEKTMGREVYSKSGVEIDRCGCGIWLDKGELAKIRAYRAQAIKELRAAHEREEYPAELYERAYSRFFFDLGTPPE